jgi:hypothetical protein
LTNSLTGTYVARKKWCFSSASVIFGAISEWFHKEIQLETVIVQQILALQNSRCYYSY